MIENIVVLTGNLGGSFKTVATDIRSPPGECWDDEELAK